MTNPEDRWTCSRCLMSFRIGPPSAGDQTQTGRCPQCGLKMWDGQRIIDGRTVAVVGMEQRPT